MVKLREKSRQGLTPDQLGTYIKVSKPGVWLLLGTIVVLLAAFITWFFAGTITQKVPAGVLIRGNTAEAYIPLSRASEVKVGDTIELTRRDEQVQGAVTAIGNVPVSLDTVRELCGEDAAEAFGSDTWGVKLEIESGAAQGVYSAWVITARHRPIRLLLGLE